MFSSLEYYKIYTKWNPKLKTIGRPLTLTLNETFNRFIDFRAENIKMMRTNRKVRLRKTECIA